MNEIFFSNNWEFKENIKIGQNKFVNERMKSYCCVDTIRFKFVMWTGTMNNGEI